MIRMSKIPRINLVTLVALVSLSVPRRCSRSSG
jgi:hypothetical protein